MIIIKGQSGNISNVIHVELDESKTAIFGLIERTRIACLGQGYSKERAKEVMEEIEEHIRQAYVAREFKVSVEDFNSLEHKNYYILNLKENAIYTMPKE